jgi:hypothetical protein
MKPPGPPTGGWSSHGSGSGSGSGSGNGSDDIIHLWFAAANGDVVRLRQLAARGVDVTIADYDRRSALHVAASNSHLAAVRFLVRVGADPGYVDSFGSRAVDDAAREGHRAVEEELRHASTQQPPVRAPPTSKAQLVELIESQGISCSGFSCGCVVEERGRGQQGAEGLGLRTTARNLIAPVIIRELAKLSGDCGGGTVDVTSQTFRKQEAEPQTISRVMSGNLVVPNFPQFKAKMQGVFDRASTATTTATATTTGHSGGMLPGMQQHQQQDGGPALGVCTVDGQRMRCGEGPGEGEGHMGRRFALGELIRPVLYLRGVSQLGLRGYHSRVGREPCPSDATEVELNPRGLPFNPMTTSGAILVHTPVCCIRMLCRGSVGARYAAVRCAINILCFARRNRYPAPPTHPPTPTPTDIHQQIHTHT